MKFTDYIKDNKVDESLDKSLVEAMSTKELKELKNILIKANRSLSDASIALGKVKDSKEAVKTSKKIKKFTDDLVDFTLNLEDMFED